MLPYKVWVHVNCQKEIVGTCLYYQATSFHSIVMETDFTARFLSKKLRFGSVAFFECKVKRRIMLIQYPVHGEDRESPPRGLLIQPLQKLIRDRIV